MDIVAELDRDPHPVLARLRAAGPVCWVEPLGAWLVTGYRQAVQVLRDSRTFTVDDPRFTTARVTGPSMLSLDGGAHARHRGPFTRMFSSGRVREDLTGFIGAEAVRLVTAIRPRGRAELRRAFAGPLAATVIAHVLGLEGTDAGTILDWYDGIVAAVQDAATRPGTDRIPSRSFAELAAAVRASGQSAGTLTPGEYTANVAVLMFGAIETTEGMITNALLHLCGDPPAWRAASADPDHVLPLAVEESLRLEPAAAVVDRYATRDTGLGGARIREGDQVTVSIAGANRDPAVFRDPDVFDPHRPNASRHLAFAHGPHFCLGAHLARLETVTAVRTVLHILGGLRLEGAPAPRGLVFRKPPELRAAWEAPGR